MSEKDLENDESQDGISPEFLKYIDEKEALDHKIKIVENEEKKEKFDENLIKDLVLPLSGTENLANTPSVFAKNRFTCRVPDHFICRICSNIVKNPLECYYCENLLCTECKNGITLCPFGCETLKFKPIAKFAANVYLEMTLDCKNKPFGCTFSNSIRNILIHEETCPFVLVKCENSLCDRLIMKKEKEKLKPGTPLLCSEICENLIKFLLLIDEDNKIETLQSFNSLSTRSKNIIEYEVKVEMHAKYKKIEEKRAEAEAFQKKKDRICKDIENWKNSHHPGKWNIRTNKWSCCGSNEVITLGCKYIVQ